MCVCQSALYLIYYFQMIFQTFEPNQNLKKKQGEKRNK